MNKPRLLLIGLLLLVGCQAAPSNCSPVIRNYTPEFQKQAFIETQSIVAPKVKEMLDDCLALRDQVRVCKGK